MSRQKKIKTVQQVQTPKEELPMTEVLDETVTHDEQIEAIETEIARARAELEATKRQIEEKKHELKSMPMREVDADEMIIVKKQQARSQNTSGLQDKIEKQKAYDNEKITGKFMNRRAPGQKVKLTYLKYVDDPVKWYEMEDGKVYTIPRGFSDQINEHYYTPNFIQKAPDQFLDPNKPESAISEVDTSNKKYAFVPINF